MEVIPAIDIKGGKCVRLRQGQFTEVMTYSEDPVEMALKWQLEGAARLHVVDLDGARVGSPQNVNTVRQIIRRVRIPVQLGGGIRNAEIIERMLRIGVDRVILGTAAAMDRSIAANLLTLYSSHLLIGIDARDGKVAVRGWQEQLNRSAVQFARDIESLGARGIIFTDIARDGMLQGPNLTSLQEMLNAVRIPVIASGGVASLQDIRKLKEMNSPNLAGVIVGKALYAETLRLSEAIAVTADGTSG